MAGMGSVQIRSYWNAFRDMLVHKISSNNVVACQHVAAAPTMWVSRHRDRCAYRKSTAVVINFVMSWVRTPVLPTTWTFDAESYWPLGIALDRLEPPTRSVWPLFPPIPFWLVHNYSECINQKSSLPQFRISTKEPLCFLRLRLILVGITLYVATEVDENWAYISCFAIPW